MMPILKQTTEVAKPRQPAYMLFAPMAGRVGRASVLTSTVFVLSLFLSGCFLSEEEKALRKLQTQGVPTTTESVFAALDSGDKERLDLLLKVSVSLEGKNERGQSPLISAICLDDQSAVEQLIPLTSTHQLAAEDNEGLTALGHAVAKKQHNLIAELIQRGAPADVDTECEEKAIDFAVRQGDLQMVEILVGETASPNLLPDLLQEPLYNAVKTGKEEIAELLLNAGADPNYVSVSDGRSPLAAAVEADHTELARLLAEKGAAMLCVLPAASVASGKPADGKILEPHLMSVAFDHENLDMIRLLIDLKAPLDHPDKDGATPLKRALDKKNVSLVKLLLSHGADPGDTLFLALEQASPDVIDLLLAHGASLDRKNPEGDTPLHIAIERGDDKLIDQLLESEPNLTTKGRHGQTAFALAVARQNLSLMERLLKQGADPNQVFAHENLQDSFKDLISSKNFLFYLKRDAGLTPIMLAAAYGNADMVQLLMNHGARRFKTSKKWHRWPVNFACDGEHIKCAQLLLGRSADSTRDVRVTISLSKQQATIYKNGEAVMSSNVSTGMRGYRTPKGKFVITNKRRHHTSSIYGSPMPYFQRLSCQAFGFHVGHCPGYPASHGCIRMPHSKARAFFSTTKVGDPVDIVP